MDSPNQPVDWSDLTERLSKRWRMVAITVVVAICAAVVLALQDDARYTAQAILVVAKPGAVLEFDPRYHEWEADPASPYQVESLRAYPELALTPAFAAAVRQRLIEGDSAADSPLGLLRKVEVRVMAEGGLIAVEASGATPVEASRLANAWAETLSAEAARLRASPSGLEAVLALRSAASAELEEADRALIEFRRTSSLAALQVESDDLAARYRTALESQGRLSRVADDVTRLGAAGSGGEAIALQVAAAAFELGAVGAATDTLSVALHLPAAGGGQPLSGADAQRLAGALRESSEAARGEAEALSDLLIDAQARLERERLTEERLSRERELAEEHYLTISRRADELEVVTSQLPEVRLAFAAAPPSERDLSGVFQLVLVALVLGLLIGSGLAVLLPPRTSSADG